MSAQIRATLCSRLASLRSAMSKLEIEAYVVPHQDAHNSEYLAKADERVAFISGFTGSNGTCVVTANKALLWTDGRYFTQAENQLPDFWTLMRDGEKGVPRVSEYLISSSSTDAVNGHFRVGVDSRVIAASTFADWSNKFKLTALDCNLVDDIWGAERPPHGVDRIVDHPIEFSGVARETKFADVAKEMKANGASLMILSALDEIAWLFNMRGTDIDYNPLFFAYAAVVCEGESVRSFLFTDIARVDPALLQQLRSAAVEVEPYDHFFDWLGEQARVLRDNGLTAAGNAAKSTPKVWLDQSTASHAIVHTIDRFKLAKVEDEALPVTLAKARKNEVEVRGAVRAHVRDGVAKTKFLAWAFKEMSELENTPKKTDSKPESMKHDSPKAGASSLKAGASSPKTAPKVASQSCSTPRAADGTLDEVSVADVLERRRKAAGVIDASVYGCESLFRGLSFPSISSFGSNAAVIHYKPEKGSCKSASLDEIYLIDSGAQYLDGTTDVTRTVYFSSKDLSKHGPQTDKHGSQTTERFKKIQRAFTRTLQGVIDLASAVFPRGTNGPTLEVLARQHLWSEGYEFRHGVGHGVGSYLCVHEGPQCICTPTAGSAKSGALKVPLEPGMLVSDEPGYYEAGNFGIRIENVIVVVETNIPHRLRAGENMLGFKTLTLVPIQKDLVDKTLLTSKQLDWLNNYHKEVFDKLSPHFDKDSFEYKFLVGATSPM